MPKVNPKLPPIQDILTTQDMTAKTGIHFDITDHTNICCDTCIHYDDGDNDYCSECSNYLNEYECFCHINPPCGEK